MTTLLITLVAAWLGLGGVTAAMPQNASKERRLKMPAGVQVHPPFYFSPDGSLVAALSQKGRRKNVEQRMSVQSSLVAKSATTGKTLWEVKRASPRGTTALAAIPSSDEFLFVNYTGVERRCVVTG